MSHILVKFVEDGIYHMCPRNNVRYDTEELGLVSAKYKGIFFRAVVVAEGEKEKMEEMKQRCILNDSLVLKYKFPSPSATSPASQSCSGSRPTSDNFRRALFVEEEKKPLPGPSTNNIYSPGPSYTELQTHNYEDDELFTVNDRSLAREMKNFEEQSPVYEEEEVAEPGKNTCTSVKGVDGGWRQTEESVKRKLKRKRTEEEGGEKKAKEAEHQQTEPEDHEEKEEETFESLPQIPQLQLQQGNAKKYYCPFCRQLYSKFGRHLMQVHGGEEKIKKVQALTPNHPERIKIIGQLRAEGSRIFNSLNTSSSNKLVPRKKIGANPEEYIACYMCGALYKKRFLHRHVKRCPSAEGAPIHNPLRTSKMHQYSLAEDDKTTEIQFSRDVLSGIREGEVKQVITTDPLIRQYGQYLCSFYGTERHLINLIRGKLRKVAEVLLEMRKMDKDIVHLDEIFCTTKKSTLFQAVKIVTGFHDGKFKRPAMANEMSTLLQHCARRLISRLLEANENEKVKEVKRWIELIKSDYNALISKHARKDLDEGKWNKPKTLPLTEDLIKLNTFVKKTAEDAIKTLSSDFQYDEWVNLNKATMVKILIFNRKRVGDVQRIRIEDIKKAHNVQKGSITYNLLTESEQITCSKYLRVEVRGKHGKVVPMLLTKDMLANVNKIITLRQQAGIPDTNRFVFAKNKDEPFPASSTLRFFAYNCGSKCPRFLTGTKLRQEIATATQAFNFSENDLSVLANYLGHTLQTHRQFYRLPDEAIQLAKISKILEIVDSGKAADIRGKSLAELEDYVTSRLEEANVEEGIEPTPDNIVSKDQPGTPKIHRTVIRRTWTTPEKRVMRSYFKYHLTNGTLPSPDECKDAKFKFSPLRTRSVEQIKAWVNNYNRKLQKSSKKN